MTRNRDRQKIFTSAKDKPCAATCRGKGRGGGSSCDGGHKVNPQSSGGETAPPLLAESTAGTVHSRELSLVGVMRLLIP